MDYNHITNFLEKFKKLIYQKEEVKELARRVISEEISFNINKEDLKIKGGFIYIKASPIQRSEILIHKKQILEKLKSLIPNNNFIDIK